MNDPPTSQTDRQMDRRTTCDHKIRALHYSASRGKKCSFLNYKFYNQYWLLWQSRICTYLLFNSRTWLRLGLLEIPHSSHSNNVKITIACNSAYVHYIGLPWTSTVLAISPCEHGMDERPNTQPALC